jgi:hypothetical protein
MMIYAAGVYVAHLHLGGNLWLRMTDQEKKQRLSVDHILESYHYIHKKTFVERIRKDKTKVFLDSGAFSAFTKGVKIDLRRYCDYIKRNEDLIRKDDGVLCASVLDGIGDPLLTYQNQLAMEQLGVRPLPCFHYGEDERYLEWYIQNYDYITLGGMVPISTPQLYYWLDRIWGKYLTDGAGRARLKVHGFGLTTRDLMERYPWYSVDSSTWVQTAKVGGVIFPNTGKVLNISKRAPQRRVEGQHIDTLPEIMAERAWERLAAAGLPDRDRAQNVYLARWLFNLSSFVQAEKIINEKTDGIFLQKQMEIFECYSNA